MISLHKDGQMIADTCKLFRIKQVRGSSDRPASDPKGAKNRGGRAAFRAALSTLRAGSNLAITPDGPRGPRMHVQDGVIKLAQSSNAKVILCSYSTNRGKTIKSWDRFLLPYPFGRAVFITSEPISISKDLSPEAQEKTRKNLENQLNNMTRQADEWTGRTPVEPA